MVQERCATCRWWDREAEEVDDCASEESGKVLQGHRMVMAERRVTMERWGKCRLAVAPDEQELPAERVRPYCDDPYDGAYLLTRDDFGCTEHEEVSKEPM